MPRTPRPKWLWEKLARRLAGLPSGKPASRRPQLRVEGLERREVPSTAALSRSGLTGPRAAVVATLPARPVFDLDPAHDTAPAGDRATSFSVASFQGRTSPGAVVTLKGRTVMAGRTGTFTIQNVPLDSGENRLTATAVRNGATSRYTVLVTREDPAKGVTVLRDEGRFLTEKEVAVSLGEGTVARRVRFELRAALHPAGRGAATGDFLLVSLVDLDQPGRTYLGRRPGGPLLTLSAAGAEGTPGVRLDGTFVELDVTALTGLARPALRFQLLSHTPGGSSEAQVGPVRLLPDEGAPPSPLPPEAVTADPAGPGVAVSLRGYKALSGLELLVDHVRYDAATDRYHADLRLRNIGRGTVARNVAVTFPGLPAGAVVENASGTVGRAIPYLNFSPAIPSGGLAKGEASDPVHVVILNPDGARFTLQPRFLGTGPNRAPNLAPVGQKTVFVGGTLTVRARATDPDGDRVTYALRGARVPTHEVRADGSVVFAPRPGETGTYRLTLVAADGSREVLRPFTLRVPVDPVTTTRVSGVVLDVSGAPVPTLRVDVGAVSGLTGDDGSFHLDLGDGPTPAQTLKVRGELLEGYPFVAEKLPFLLGHEVYPGANNVIARPIYLPVLDPGVDVDPARESDVTNPNDPALAGTNLRVAAGSLLTQQGAPYDGAVSITEVPVGLTPASLPEGLYPDVVVTIQPGEMVFAQPARLTLPNRSGFERGTVMDLWSIDPVTGEFRVVGAGAVSEDGRLVETTSGGVRNSSWHFFSARGGRGENPNENANNQDGGCNCGGAGGNTGAGGTCPAPSGTGGGEAAGPATSSVEFHSGALREAHDLVTYQSVGVTRGVSLHYDSQRADPRPILHFGFADTASNFPDLRLVANLKYGRGSPDRQLPGFDGAGPVLKAGDHIWAVPSDAPRADAALQMDLRDVPTGVIDYALSARLVRVANGYRGSDFAWTGQIVHVNAVRSPFGSGWGIGDQVRITVNPDGSALLVGGNGVQLRFRPPAGAPGGGEVTYLPPPGDFSTLVRLPDGTFRRSLKDGTVHTFNAGHWLESVRDRNGNKTEYVYDGDRLLKIVDPVKLETRFTYTGSRVTAITDPAGRVTRLGYDGAGNLVRITDPDGSFRTFEYDADHHLTAEIDKRGFREEASYHFSGRVVGATLKDGSSVRVTPAQIRGLYRPGETASPETPPRTSVVGGAQATYVDASGNRTVHILDKAGQIVSSADQLGPLPSVRRGGNNLVTETTDPNGYATSYTYDARGNVIEITDEVSEGPVEGTVWWVASASGSWSDAANWSTGKVPGPADVVVINRPNQAITVQVAGNVTVRGLHSTEDLVVTGGTLRLTGKARLSGRFTMTNGRLVAAGPDASVLTNGPEVSINRSSLEASGGGALRLRNLKVYDGGRSGAGGPTFEFLVNGVGSLIDLPSLERLHGVSDLPGFNRLSIRVRSGGTLLMPVATEVSGGNVDLVVANPGSSAQLGNLGSIASFGTLSVTDSGVVTAPVLAQLSGQTLSLDATGVFPTGQLTAVTNGGISFTGAPRDFGRVAAIDGSNLQPGPGMTLSLPTVTGTVTRGNWRALSGAVIRLPNVAGYAGGSSGAGRPSFEFVADGAGSLIDLPALTTITGVLDTPGFNRLSVRARNGGAISMPAATGIAQGSVDLSVANPGSHLDLRAVTSIASFGTLSVTSSGRVTAPLLTRLVGQTLTLDASGDFPTAQLTGITGGGGISLQNTTRDFGSVAQIDNSSLTAGPGSVLSLPGVTGQVTQGNWRATGGGVLRLPNVTAYAGGSSGAGRPSFEFAADGAGSLIDLPALKTLTGIFDHPSFNRLSVRVTNGAALVAPAATALPGGNIDLLATGAGSRIEFPALETVSSSGTVRATGGAALSFAPSLSVRNATVVLTPTGSVGGLVNLDLLSGSTLSGSGSFPFAVRNAAVLDPAGRLTLASLTQEATGTLRVGIGGPAPGTQYDQLALTGSATFGGVLALSTVNGFQPAEGQTFTVLEYASQTGAFGSVTGRQLPGGLEYALDVGPSRGALTVVQGAGLLRFAPPDSGGSGSEVGLAAKPPARAEVLPARAVSDEEAREPWVLAESPEPAGSVFSAFHRVAGDGTGVQPKRFTYESTFNRLTSFTDELGHQTLYAIDPENGNVLSMTRVVGEPDSEANGETDDVVTTYHYNTRGQVTEEKDPLGRITAYEYDEFGRRIEVTHAKGTEDEAIERFGYDRAGNVTSRRNGNEQETRYTFDAMNRVKTVTEPDPDGPKPKVSPVTRYQYDLAGNRTQMTDAEGHVTRYDFDVLGREVKEIAPDPDGAGPLLSPETKTVYDRMGNQVQVIDPLGQATRYEYDARGQVVASIDPDDGVTRFTYDPVGNLTSLRDPGGNLTRFEYDSRDRLIGETDPLGKTITYGYDASDNLIEKTDRLDRLTRYNFDDLERLTTETWVGGGNEFTFAYDKVGNLRTAQDTFSSLTYEYDFRNRVKLTSNAGTPGAPVVELKYTYDDENNVRSVTDTIDGVPGATTSYDYDFLGRLEVLKQSGVGVSPKRVDFAYNGLGQYERISRFSDLTGTAKVADTDYAYDGMNRLSSLGHRNGSTTLAGYGYNYDADTRITRIDSVREGIIEYGYDDRDQLTRADYANSDIPDELYRYDANGNRLESHLHGTGYVTLPNTANRLMSDGTYTYQYDAEGNLTTRTETATGALREYGWDQRNRLIRVVDSFGPNLTVNAVRFTYDSMNRRNTKSAGDNSTTHYVYDREDVILDMLDEYDNGTHRWVVANRYLHGPGIDQIMTTEQQGEAQWVLPDHLGSARDVMGASGAVVNHSSFDSFGQVLSQTDETSSIRYRFAGREWDRETGLHLFRSRYLASDTGRFLSEDWLRFKASDVNLRRYVLNQPSSKIDPLGFDGFGFGAGGTFGGNVGPFAGEIGFFTIAQPPCKLFVYAYIGGGPGIGLGAKYTGQAQISYRDPTGLAGIGIAASGFVGAGVGVAGGVGYSPGAGATTGGGGVGIGAGGGVSGLVTYTWLWNVYDDPKCFEPCRVPGR